MFEVEIEFELEWKGWRAVDFFRLTLKLLDPGHQCSQPSATAGSSMVVGVTDRISDGSIQYVRQTSRTLMLLLNGCGNNTICYESILPINKTFRSWCFLKELVYWMIVGVIHRIFDGRILLGGSSSYRWEWSPFEDLLFWKSQVDPLLQICCSKS